MVYYEYYVYCWICHISCNSWSQGMTSWWRRNGKPLAPFWFLTSVLGIQTPLGREANHPSVQQKSRGISAQQMAASVVEKVCQNIKNQNRVITGWFADCESKVWLENDGKIAGTTQTLPWIPWFLHQMAGHGCGGSFKRLSRCWNLAQKSLRPMSLKRKSP